MKKMNRAELIKEVKRLSIAKHTTEELSRLSDKSLKEIIRMKLKMKQQ